MLQSGSVKQGVSFAYKYGADNLRYSKTVNGVETVYYWDNGTLIGEKTGNNYTQYLYDSSGIIGMIYNGSYYFFEKNLFGDVLRAYNANGSEVARFLYDSYGNLASSSGTMADKVNFRYRGYYYDAETDFYYLHTRYYSPEICRFISADQPELVATLSKTLGQLNLFAYCNNNPIMYTDPDGKAVGAALFWGALIGLIVGGASYVGSEVISYALTGEWDWSWGMFIGSLIGGAIGGMLGVSSLHVIIVSGITGGISTASGMLLQNAFGEASNNVVDIVKNTFLSIAVSMGTTYIMNSLPLQGFNCGRGSFQQVAKQINTKMLKNQISGITSKTFGKILAYNLGYSCLGSVMSAVIEWVQLYYQRHPPKRPQIVEIPSLG